MTPAGRAVPVPLQRFGRPAVVRADLGDPGAPVAHHRPVRRPARPRADHAEPVDARRAVGARPGGGDVPHRDDPLPGDGRGAGSAADRAGEDHRPDRGQRAGPPGAGRAPRRRRLGDPQRGRRSRGSPTPNRWPGWPGRDGGARSASSAGSPSSARASRCWPRRSSRSPPSGPGCGCWWPGRASATICSRCCRSPCTTGSRSSARSPRRTRRGCCAASTSTSRRTRGGESFGMILTEAMAAGTPIVASDLDAFRRVLDGGRAGLLFPIGDADGADEVARASCSTTRPGGPRTPPRRPASSPRTTGRRSPSACWRSTRWPSRRRRANRSTSTRPRRSSAPVAAAAAGRRRVTPVPRSSTTIGHHVVDRRRGRAGRARRDLPDLDCRAGRPDCTPAPPPPPPPWTPRCCAGRSRSSTPPTSWPGPICAGSPAPHSRATTAPRPTGRTRRTRSPRVYGISPHPGDVPALADVIATSRRVSLARHIHNDLVRDALAMRRRRLVRVLGLGRRAPAAGVLRHRRSDARSGRQRRLTVRVDVARRSATQRTTTRQRLRYHTVMAIATTMPPTA